MKEESQKEIVEPIKNNNERLSGFELLRIISMLMIIGCHLVLNNGVNSSSLPLFNEIVFNFWAISGKIGVNIFILISGYFLVGKKFNFRRLINIILQTTFYALVFYAAECIITNQFSIKAFFVNLFPILFDKYWFVTAYFLLMLIYPLLNIIIKNISKNTHLLICIIGFVLSAMLPILKMYYFTANVLWFAVLYFVASYIKLYVIKVNKIVLPFLIILFYTCSIANCILRGSNFAWFNSNTIFNFSISLCIFMLFLNMKFKSKIVNVIASTALGIYLIHDNQPYGYSKLWSFVGQYISFSTAIFPIYSIFIILSIFLICMLIELIRLYLIHKPLEKLYYKKIYPKLQPHFEKLLNKFKKEQGENIETN